MSSATAAKTDFIVCTEDTPIEKVYEMLEAAKARHAFVVESLAHQIPIGIVTEHDICAHLIGSGRSPRGMTAAGVMSTNFAKIRAGTEPDQARSAAGSTHLICIVDENGAPCGTVSPAEVDSPKVSAAETISSTVVIRQFQVSVANRIY